MAAFEEGVRALTIEEIDMVSGGDLTVAEVLNFLEKAAGAIIQLIRDALDNDPTPTPPPPPPPPPAPPAGA